MKSLPNSNSIGQVPDAVLQNVLARVGLGTTQNTLELSEASVLKALESPNWNVRASALQALETLGKQVPLRPVLVALDDEDGSVRAIAVRILGNLAHEGEHVPVERLLVALHDSEWHVRETTVFALEKLGGHAYVEALHSVLHDADADVQEAAKLVLQQMENKSSPIPLSSEESSHKEASLSTLQSQTSNTAVPIHEQRAHRRNSVHRLRDQFYSNYNRLKRRALHNQETGDNEMLGEHLNSRNVDMTTGSIRAQKLPEIKHRPVIRVIEGVFAAIIITGIITAWFVLTHGLHPATAGTILFTQNVQGNNYTFPGWTSDSKDVIWSGDLASGTDEHLYVWDATTKQFSKWGPIPGVADVETAPDGRHISRVTADGKIRIWDLVTGRSTTIYTGRAGQYPGVTWSSDSKRIALTLEDGTVQILNVDTGKVLVTFYPNHSSNQQSQPLILFWSQNGQRIATSFYGSKSIQIWDAATGKQVQTIADIGAGLVGLSPDGQRIFVTGDLRGSSDSSIRIWNAVTGRKLLTYTGHSKRPTTFAMLPDGRRLLSKSDNEVLIWDTITGHTILKFANNGSINGLSWSPDGKYIEVGNGVDTVQVWNAITGLKISTYRIANAAFVKGSGSSIFTGSLDWSPNGKYLISAGKGGTSAGMGRHHREHCPCI